MEISSTALSSHVFLRKTFLSTFLIIIIIECYSLGCLNNDRKHVAGFGAEC